MIHMLLHMSFNCMSEGLFVCLYIACIHVIHSFSALDEPSEEGEAPDVAEMPIDLDIEVESVGLDENEIEQLRQDTRYSLE